VQCRIPNVILIPDTIDDIFKIQGKVNVSPENTMELIREGIASKIAFKRRVRKADSFVVMAIEDVRGEFTDSQCFIYFDETQTAKVLNKYSIDSLPVPETFSFLLKEVCLHINQFLQHYRHVSEKHWITNVDLSAISPIAISYYLEGDSDQHTHKIDYRGTGVGIGCNLSAKQHGLLERLCLENDCMEYELCHEYIMESNRYKIRKDFPPFVLFLAFYIDAWITREIVLKYLKEGLPQTQVDQMVLDKNGRVLYPGPLLQKKLGNKKYDQVTKTKEFREYKHIKEVRDSLAHGRRVSITEDDAERFVNYAMSYRDLLLKWIWADD
jgi:hypothetical protein